MGCDHCSELGLAQSCACVCICSCLGRLTSPTSLQAATERPADSLLGTQQLLSAPARPDSTYCLLVHDADSLLAMLTSALFVARIAGIGLQVQRMVQHNKPVQQMPTEGVAGCCQALSRATLIRILDLCRPHATRACPHQQGQGAFCLAPRKAGIGLQAQRIGPIQTGAFAAG